MTPEFPKPLLVKVMLTLFKMTDDLDAVVEWSLNNNLTLHEDKFVYICHSAKKDELLAPSYICF